MGSTHMLCTHLLKLRYPAPELLPSGRRPYLEVPRDVGYREKPKLGTYHLSATNLDFFVQLPAEPATNLPEPLDTDDDNDITECVCWLTTSPGVSELSAVSFLDDADIVTRFSPKTTWFTAQGKTAEQEKQFKLSSAAWQLLQSYADPESKESWIALMNDLIMAGSDRAIFHCRQQLDQYDKDFADSDESTWVDDWDARPEVWPNQLLANHLEHMASTVDEDTVYAPVVTLSMYNDIEDILVRLPCNHQCVISIEAVRNLSTEDRFAAHCEVGTCGRRIMDKRDEQLLELATRKQERAQ